MKENTERWHARVVAWRESGESMAAYCRRKGLKSSALGYWKGRLERAEATDDIGESAVSMPPRMARVRRVPAAGPKTSGVTQALRVVLRSATVEVPPGFDGVQLDRVLEALARREAP